jgi:hypothetical protein
MSKRCGDFLSDAAMGESMKSRKGSAAISRRSLLRAGGCALGLALFGAGPAFAQEGESEIGPKKISQKDAAYQPQPSSGSKCLICRSFMPAGECHLVEGAISPNGWCKLYVMSWHLPS